MIAHLMFAHMLADYALQSNWLVSRKVNSWTGLALHGGIVGFIAAIALLPYLEATWGAVILLAVLHTLQDTLKVRYGRRLNIPTIIPYMTDQGLHYATIGLLYLWAGSRIQPAPGSAEIAFMWTGAAVITVTRFYDVTLWAKWLDLIPHMNRWRTFSYVERLAMLALATAGLWMLAPLCVLPRLVESYHQQRPIWRQRRGLMEMAGGIVLSTLLGVGLHLAYLPL